MSTTGRDAPPAAAEQTRARYPDEEGYVERDGVRIFYEVYGMGEPTVLLMPTWSIVHSRHWKMQIPYFARHSRVLTFDGRGNGRSDRPADADAYREEEFAADAIAVMDATGTERAVLVSLSRGAERSLHLAASYPERVDKLVFIAPALPLAPATPRLKAIEDFGELRDEYIGWGKWNRHYWVEHYEDFLEFFFSQCFTEPHSTKPREDMRRLGSRDRRRDARRHSAGAPAPGRGERAGAPLPDRVPDARDPRKRRRRAAVRIRRAARGACGRRARRPRGVGTSPPCPRPGQGQPAPPRLRGPGHAAAELGARASLAASARSSSRPRSGSGTRRETRRSPTSCASSILTSRSTGSPSIRSRRCSRRGANGSIRPARFSRTSRTTSRASRPSTTCTASRRSGEWMRSCSPTSCSSTTSSARSRTTSGSATRRGSSTTTCTRTRNRSASPYVWLTDFVGWLPMPDGGEHEAFLTGDYNEEMIEHIARFPRVRDQAVFVGNPDDIVPERFASHLPVDPGLDRGALLLRRLRHGLRSRRLRRPGGAQGRTRLRRGRAGLHRHRRRLGRRRRPSAARDRRLPRGEGTRAGAANDRRRRPADPAGDAA